MGEEEEPVESVVEMSILTALAKLHAQRVAIKPKIDEIFASLVRDPFAPASVSALKELSKEVDGISKETAQCRQTVSAWGEENVENQ